MLLNLFRKDKLGWMIRKERLLQKLFGKAVDIRKSWENTPAQFTAMVDFLNWFDTTSSIDECVKKSAADWKYRFADMPYFLAIGKGRCLEIGFGGGRLLLQASKHFETALGVDIHSSFEMTRKFLHSQGRENFELHHRDHIGNILDASVDFVYSFIVFQHFDSVEEVEFYLNHIHRILKPGAIAHIYFGKNKGSGIKVSHPNEFELRDCSLFIEPEAMRKLVTQRFSLVDHKDRLPRDPISGAGESAQSYVVLKK